MSEEVCGAVTTAGAVAGGLAGLGVAIWVCVDVIQPAFATTNGINTAGSQALTALVALGGELEVGIAGGALAGIIAIGALACFAACCAGVCSTLLKCSSSSPSHHQSPTSPTLFAVKQNQPLGVPPDLTPAAKV